LNGIRVKICGLTRKEDLKVAVAAGADAVGFVVDVPSSPRNIPLDKAKKLIQLVPIFVKSVLVTVPESFEDLKIYTKLQLDALQIHGENLSASFFQGKKLSIPIIRGINVKSFDTLETAFNASKIFDAILLDSSDEKRYGGTGIIHNWELSAKVKDLIHPKPLILAGGLAPRNFIDAIRIVQPYAVDVSSGVESQPGIKSSQKIIKFIQKAKEVTI
jgi:phosphoribosylanthranilate isomerase